MKSRKRNRQVEGLGMAAAIALAGVAAMSSIVRSDVLQWDGNGTAPLNPAGGSGGWEIANNWWNGSNNQSYSSGTTPHDAIFGVAAGSVNIATGVTAASLTFNINGYTVTGANLTIANGGAITVTNLGDVATITAPIAASSGFTKLGAGTLTLSSAVANTFNGMTIRGGIVSFTATGHLGDVNGLITIDGATLRLTGTTATTSPNTRNFFAGPNGATINVASITSGSNTGLTIAGRIDGPGTVTKTGVGTLRLDRANSTFSGGLVISDGVVRFNNNNDAGPKSLRMNRISFGANTSNLNLGGSGASADASPGELRTGEWNSIGAATGSIIAATTVVGGFGASGHDLLIMALADGTFAGTVDNTRLANGGTQGTTSHDGNFRVRGVATQTLTGTTNVNNTITVYQNAGLTLAGNAAMTGQGANVNLRGGTMTLDNSVTNLADRLRNTGPVEPRGGGTFAFIGNAAGSSESLGALQLGTLQTIRSGAMTVSVTHVATGAATVLTFDNLTRDHGATTVDFTARNGVGGTLALGGAGNAPRIVFTTTPSLASGTNLLQSNNGATGWATVNGSSFATVGANGIEPVATVAFAGAGASDNALLTSTAIVSGASDKAVGSLKIDPSAGQTLDLSGSANLATSSILLAGANDFEIRNTGGGTGAVAPTNTFFAHVQQATLKISAPITGNGGLVKAGGGTLEIIGANTYTGATTLNAGVLRSSVASLGSGVLEFRGGVLEITGGGTFSRNLGIAAGQVNWVAASEDLGGGGFAARGANVSIDLSTPGPTNIFYEATNFLESGYDLAFGSRTADAAVTWTDNLVLNTLPNSYNTRDIRVTDNPGSASDIARISGVISSDTAANNGVLSDLMKTGDGTLELTAANTYVGGTIIAEGTLLLGNAQALGDPTGPYVLLGNRGGNKNAALLTSAAVNISRNITVQAGNSGTSALGGSSAQTSTFSGDILIQHSLDLTAATGGNVTLSGNINNDAQVAVRKLGAGDVNIRNLRGGSLTINAGKLAVMPNGGPTGTSRISSITMTGGQFDLNDNDLIITSMSRVAVESLVQSGFGNFDWQGTGIMSSTAATFAQVDGSRAVGVIDNADWGHATFGGQTVSSTDILVKYTWVADANVDGLVDNDDFGQFLFGFSGSGPAVWLNGDFDYNGVVDNDDFGWFLTGLSAFNASGNMQLSDSFEAGLKAFALEQGIPFVLDPTPVPEPTTPGVLGLAALAMGIRRRRRSATADCLR